jgi:hypothetical protein
MSFWLRANTRLHDMATAQQTTCMFVERRRSHSLAVVGSREHASLVALLLASTRRERKSTERRQSTAISVFVV